ncbi:MAG: hypothetical protein WA840_22460 [Caulobacteraceae bacterium]
MRTAEDGSILVEALVSSAIVAMMLATAYQVIGESAARHQKVEARRYALMIARSQLAAVGSATPLAAGAVDGRDGDDTWRVEMSPCGSGKSTTGVLYCVDVSVRGPDSQAPLVSLSSRRLAPQA